MEVVQNRLLSGSVGRDVRSKDLPHGEAEEVVE